MLEKLINALRKKNRTVLEVDLGIIFCGIILQVGAALFAPDKLEWCLSFLLGSVLAMLAIWHMYRTLDRALDFDEGTAGKLIYRGYLTRYFVLVAVILFLIGMKWLNPLLVFLAYMTMKVAVYLQPFAHKLSNKFFHETDPEPESMEQVEGTDLESTDIEGTDIEGTDIEGTDKAAGQKTMEYKAVCDGTMETEKLEG